MRRWLFLLVVGIPLVGMPVLAGVGPDAASPRCRLPAFAQVQGGLAAVRGLAARPSRRGDPRAAGGFRRCGVWHGRRLEEVSPALRHAVVAAEDKRFAQHRGVDWLALMAAAERLSDGRSRPRCEHPQHAARGPAGPCAGLAGRRRSPGQKLAQVRAALALERRWSKDQILEAYLNLAGFRGELQGVRRGQPRALLQGAFGARRGRGGLARGPVALAGRQGRPGRAAGLRGWREARD